MILINRNEEFARCKEGNLDARAGGDQGRQASSAATRPTALSVETIETDGCPARFNAKTPDGTELDRLPPRHRAPGRDAAAQARRVASASRFPNADPASVPQLSDTYESNVPGLYIIGALGGYPLIKQAMNQGYEVVEYIRGNRVAPADEPLLRQKFADYKRGAHGQRGARAASSATCRCWPGITTLQLREFLLDSDIRTPARRRDHLRPQRLHQHVLLDRRGRGRGRDRRRIGKQGALASCWAPGEFFGELALISGRRRAATVTRGHGLRADRDAAALDAEADRLGRQRAADDRRSVPQARGARPPVAGAACRRDLDDADLEGAQLKTYAAGETLFTEGDAPDGLYLLRRGSVTVSRRIGGRDVVLSYVAAGNYVGEMALLSDAPRMAHGAGGGRDRGDRARRRAVQGRRGARTRRCARSSRRGSSSASAPTCRWSRRPESGSVISYLLQQGIGEATDVLLIDESLCVRCDNCEKACADTHDGTSRLNREAGPTYAQLHVPTSCRHCEHPHCMKDCPPDAIHRAPNGEVFIARHAASAAATASATARTA